MAVICIAAASILEQATTLWPNRSRLSDGTIGDADHAARVSDHNPDSRGIVHAADLTHDPAHGCDAHYWADVIRRRAAAGDEPRLKYVISARRIASPTSSWAWRVYDGSNPHEAHAHFSVLSGPLENDGRSWFVTPRDPNALYIGGFSVADMTRAELEELLKDQRRKTIAAVVLSRRRIMERLEALASAADGATVDEIRDVLRRRDATLAENIAAVTSSRVADLVGKADADEIAAAVSTRVLDDLAELLGDEDV